jgi:class 3 adenylate cyclase
VGVAGNSSSADGMAAFVDETGVGGFAHIQDLENEIWRRYGVQSQPTFVFIDDDGSTETTRSLSESELADRVGALLES